MAQQEEIIISVDLDAGNIEKRLNDISNEMARVKEEQKELNREMRESGNVTGEQLKRQTQLKQEYSALSREQSNLSATTKTLNKTNKDYSDSLDGMRAKLSDMQKAYATLSKEQRESASGKEFLKAIQLQDEAVKGLEQSIGDARRNVGDYEGAIKRAFPSIGNFSDLTEKMTSTIDALGKGGAAAMKSLVVGFGNATKAGLKFLATPIGALIGVIGAAVGLLVAALGKLRDAFKKNDDAGTALAKLFASFEPIIDAIDKAFVRLAEGIGKVANKISEWIASFSDAAAAAQELVQAEDDLQEKERQYVVGTAKRQKQIAKLRTDAKDKEKYTAEERKQFILDAIDLEEQQAQETKEKAAEKLRILEEKAKKESDTSDETKDKIAQARADMINAETEYYNKTRELLEQRNTAENEYQAEMRARTQERIDNYYRAFEEQKKVLELEQLGIEALMNVDKIREENKKRIEEELALLREQAEQYTEEEEEVDVPSVEDLVRDKFGLDQEAIDYYNSLVDAGISKTDALGMALDKLAKDNAKGAVLAFGDMATKMASTFNGMSELLLTYGEDNEKAAKAAKAFALAGIIADQAASISSTAISITKAVEGATNAASQTGIAAPFVLAGYIASMVGMIVAQIASTAGAFSQAKQLLSSDTDAGAFEQGGVVGGTSYTGDRLTARVNSGEVILNPTQAGNVLYQLANSPTSGLFDYEAMAAAMANTPPPVMVYSEYNDFKSKVTTYNELAKI